MWERDSGKAGPAVTHASARGIGPGISKEKWCGRASCWRETSGGFWKGVSRALVLLWGSGVGVCV